MDIQRALGESIYTQGATIEEVKRNTTDAVACHFETNMPRIVRLHIVRGEILAGA